MAHGERVVIAGAVGYVVCLFLPWYRFTRFNEVEAEIGLVGPNAQATHVSLVVLLVLVAEIWRGRSRRRRGEVTRRDPVADLPRRGVVLLWLGLAMVVLVLFRLIAQPEGVHWGLFGGLAAAATIAYGTHLIEYAEALDEAATT